MSNRGAGEYASAKLAMRAVLFVQQHQHITIFGDMADLVRQRFQVSRAHSYRLAGMALDCLGRARIRRERASTRMPESARARIGEAMRQRWRDPVQRARMLKGMRETRKPFVFGKEKGPV